ncbi:hypothetical protein B0H16DRAFT_1688348 [Mycena metata]|uniref:F-box domain-containing protein n=1 Tax=Mycena metata TaxID=1033252 RepID=A0AAD7NGS3_9AGAR|nr:hypothetical protein B0H16DRAFT_1688348 [Mycena metata]
MPPEFTRLPVEILDAIASEVPLANLLALCRTNRGLYRVCLRWIYHNVSPSTPTYGVGLFKTLIANKQAANSVRVLTIHFPTREILFKSFARLMQKAASNLISLESLYYCASPDLFSVFAHFHFPRLRDCFIPISTEMATFLSRNPRVAELFVLLDPQRPLTAVNPDLASLSLPALRDFSGPGNVARAIVPNSEVAVVTISWDLRIEDEYTEVLAAISTTQEPLQKLHNLLQVWDTDLLFAIKDYLPHLTHLDFRNLSSLPPGTGELEAFYDTLETAVASLPNLLVLACISHYEHVPPAPADLAREFRAVRAWGARSPALRACLLTSNTMWLRDTGNMWHPRASSPDKAEMQWRLGWFIGLIAGAPTQFPDYADDMVEVLGPEAWATLVDENS